MITVKKMLNIAAVSSVAALAFPAVMQLPVGSTLAYLTDIGDAKVNKATIALDPSTKIVEYFPTFQISKDDPTVYNFKKGVQVFNDGYIDAYVRVRIDFTDSDLKNQTLLSWDGKNYYSFNDFCNNVESNGWHYCSADGYFYYKTAISSGDYEKLEDNFMTRDDTTHIFNWKDESHLGTTEYKGSTMLTTPLIKYVKTTFPSKRTIRNYTIDVQQDAVATYLGDNYASAWASVLGYSVS